MAGQYRTIVADPPWRYESGNSLPYPTMDIEGWIGRMDVHPRPYQLRIVLSKQIIDGSSGTGSSLS